MSGPVLKTAVYLQNDYESARRTLINEIKDTKTAVNRKTTGSYYKQEINTSQSVFGDPSDSRTVIRKLVDFGSLPNTSSKSQAHGMTFNSNTKFLKIYATATDTSNLEAISGPSADMDILVDSTNVVITTTSDLSDFDNTWVVLEYIKF